MESATSRCCLSGLAIGYRLFPSVGLWIVADGRRPPRQPHPIRAHPRLSAPIRAYPRLSAPIRAKINFKFNPF